MREFIILYSYVWYNNYLIAVLCDIQVIIMTLVLELSEQNRSPLQGLILPEIQNALFSKTPQQLARKSFTSRTSS